MASPALDLTPERVAALAPGRFFRDAGGAINSLDFHRTEDLLVCSGAFARVRAFCRGTRPAHHAHVALVADDDSLRLYDVANGVLLKTLFAKTYGVSKVAFTHAPLAVLTASGAARSDHDVRYHSLHDNTYLRFFKARAGSKQQRTSACCLAAVLTLPRAPAQGHTARVLSLDMSPKSDAFLTAAADYSARLWDVRSNTCAGALRVGPSPVAAWDHQGLVFGVVTSDGVLKMFDARGYEQGPFDTIAFAPGPAAPHASSLRFSLDGKQLLLNVGGFIHVLDAYNGQRLHCFAPPLPPQQQHVPPPCEPAFTPDARCVLCGGADGNIHVWSTTTGAQITSWRGHAGMPAVLRWSPRRALAASGCTQGGLALWIPAPEGPPPQQPQGLMAAQGAAMGQMPQQMPATMQPVMHGW